MMKSPMAMMMTISSTKFTRKRLRNWALFFSLILSTQSHVYSQISFNWEEIVSSSTCEDFHVYKTATVLNGDSITAYYFITKVMNGNLVFYPEYSANNLKPEQLLKESSGEIIALTNSGYFGTNVSYSLLLRDYQLLASNALTLNRSYNGINHTYYPTRSAFGIYANLESKAGYTYTIKPENTTYIYPTASPNSTSNPPLQQPSPSYPENGIPWTVSDAVGGGPLLIKNGNAVIDFTPELFPADIISSVAPRTAIGKTSENEIIMLIIDGRQSHSKGVSLENLTDILLGLGCTEAMNLDGGGSSCLFVDQDLINQPSDGSTRAIPSFITIKKAIKLYADSSRHFIRSEKPIDSTSITAFQYKKTLLWEQETAGKFLLNITDPAAYRIEYLIPEILPNDMCHEIQFELHQENGITRTFSLNTNNIQSKQFAYLGNYQLGKSDTLIVSNNSPNTKIPVSGLRLVRSGSGLPNISLNPAKYSGIHCYRDTLKLIFNAEAKNPDREITGYAIYESGENGLQLVSKRDLEAKKRYSDSLEYVINQFTGQVKITFAIFDEEQDSVAVSYAINLDDTPPSVALGKNSILQGNVNDTLIFELKLAPANDIRILKELLILKNPGDNEKLLQTVYPNATGDTIVFKYKISVNDVPGIYFKFIITDDTGYSSFREYALAVNNIIDKSFKPEIFYDLSNKQLHILNENGVPLSDQVEILSIDGRMMAKEKLDSYSEQHIDLSFLLPGCYISRLFYGSKLLIYKFVIPSR